MGESQPSAPVAVPAPTSSNTPATAPVPVTTPVVPPIPAPVAAPSKSHATPEAVAALTSMGFLENECKSALEAAMGNPDLAYEFLLTGIPEQLSSRSRLPAPASVPASAPAPSGGSSTLQQFRSHPQFEQLKQLVQTNPASLPQVLSVIGQQNPQLLDAIHANNEEFLAMMNEPIGSTPPAPAPAVGSSPAGEVGGTNASQIISMLSALPPEQRAQFAQQVGMSPEQLNSFVQMISQIPPDQLSQLMPGMGGGSGGGGGGGGHVIRLTEEEHAAVTRLTQLGFSQQQAVQAYLACDKNESLAANLLFDGGFGMDDEDGGMGGGYGDFGDDGGEDYN